MRAHGVRCWSDDQGDLPALEADQPAVLLYTSGTTGTPKGVPLTHAQHLRQPAGAAGGRPRLVRGSGSAAVAAASCLSADGRPAPPLAVGAAVVLPAGITGPQIMHALHDRRCTIMIAVPRLYEAMVAGIERQIAGAPRPIAAALRGLLDLRSGSGAASGGGSARRCFSRCTGASGRRCACSPRAAPGSTPTWHGSSKGSAGRC